MKRQEKKRRRTELGKRGSKKNMELNGYMMEQTDSIGVGRENFPEKDNFENEVLTEEKIKELRQEEQEQDEAINKFRSEEKREQRKLKEEMRKKSMIIPLDPLPERNMCEYEKIRENNISERENAMYESGFFEDLIPYKEEKVW
jgi:hypothetical protein